MKLSIDFDVQEKKEKARESVNSFAFLISVQYDDFTETFLRFFGYLC